MFEAIWTAFKRIMDKTVVPILIALGMYFLEITLGAVGWVIALIGDLIVSIFSAIINAIGIPDITITQDTFGSKFLDLAQIVGLWPAMLLYFGFALVALLARLLSFNIIGNR